MPHPFAQNMRSPRFTHLKHWLFLLVLLLLAALFGFAHHAYPGTVYSQPHDGSSTLHQSSWWDPDGSDYDQYVWDNFAVNSDAQMSAIRWRGGYLYDFNSGVFHLGGPVSDFTLSIYASVDYGNGVPFQPDIGNVNGGKLAEYFVGGNAGETPAGTFGGKTMYDYSYFLPAPFTLHAGKNYWVGIEAAQSGIPHWGLAAGTAGDGYYFRQIANVGDIFYQRVPGDTAFSIDASGFHLVPEPASSLLFIVGGAAFGGRGFFKKIKTWKMASS